ncbi:unnamed protein product [Protopolystoma xenopodis]|uniref:IFT121 second beta-propeller domain-containing protein n=1 Tax=Protopolystoma xenopodis TaxID=117903 RepID=A0A448WUM5_9PLAT|nr:unnamed protein product [Protopolystoma xenopodis]
MNALGTSIDRRAIRFEPCFLEMTTGYIIAANRGLIYIWHFRDPRRYLGLGYAAISTRFKENVERHSP